MITPLGELRVEARLENLRTITAFIQAIGQRLLLTEKMLFDIELSLEEATTNIVRHAYPTERKGDMLLRVEVDDENLILTLLDWGEALDPSRVKPFDLDAPVETRIQGGMGLFFIHNLVDSVERRSTAQPGQPNLLKLTKRLDRLPPDAHQPSTARELNAMLTVARTMTSRIGSEQLLERIVNVLVTTIDAERGTLYLVDAERGEVYSHVLMEDTGRVGEIRLKLGEGVAGYVAQTGKIVNRERAQDDPNFITDYDNKTGYQTRSLLAAPMRDHEQAIIGVVQLLNKKGGAFTSRDERLLIAMSALAAIIIENSRLQEWEIQQKLVNQELETARDIQRSFLPHDTVVHPGWDVAAYWRPMRDVAGDFYDLHPLPDGRLALTIGDVSGKGVPAALFMALTVTVLRFAMSLDFAPGALMQHSNYLIISDQSSRLFATIFAAYLDLDTGQLEYACAGHNPPLLYRPATGEITYLSAPGVAVGVFPNADFAQQTASLEVDDVLVLYTDGVTEIINRDEEEFGEERMEAVVAKYAASSSRTIAERIIAAASEFADGLGAFDDETLVVLKRLPT